MERHEDIMIVGGGPAGAYCAFELTKKGIFPIILNYPHPGGKPCGGGISPLVIQKFPFLEKLRSKGETFSVFNIISCTNVQVVTRGLENGFCISRQCLDREILNMAKRNGAKVMEEKVLDIQKSGFFWNVKTDKRTYSTKILVGADGVTSIVRHKTVGYFFRENLALTFGYIAHRVEKADAIIKFLSEIPGYIWVFPGKDYYNVGIGSELKYGGRLKELLNYFINSYCPQIQITRDTLNYAWMLPSAKNPNFFKHTTCAGIDWLLVGDAAGHVDPISGGGILYALWGAKLAAEAIEKKDLKSYDQKWRTEFGKGLEERCKNRDTFYDPLQSTASLLRGLAAKIYFK